MIERIIQIDYNDDETYYSDYASDVNELFDLLLPLLIPFYNQFDASITKIQYDGITATDLPEVTLEFDVGGFYPEFSMAVADSDRKELVTPKHRMFIASFCINGYTTNFINDIGKSNNLKSTITHTETGKSVSNKMTKIFTYVDDFLMKWKSYEEVSEIFMF